MKKRNWKNDKEGEKKKRVNEGKIERRKEREKIGKTWTVEGRSPGNKTWHGIEVDKTNDENALI